MAKQITREDIIDQDGIKEIFEEISAKVQNIINVLNEMSVVKDKLSIEFNELLELQK